MKATEILKSEHRVIERVIGAMEAAAERVESGQEMDPAFFIQAADFIKGFADGCHHRKEEGVLFKEMASRGFSEESGPVAMMLREHEMGRWYTRRMREAAERTQAGDLNAREQMVQNALEYAGLLRQHIQKEDMVLFPLADRVIPVDEQEQVADGFEHVEHEETGEGVHEKYLALAAQLEREVSEAAR
jgi:hemerythrin-like domain-containing protein